MSVDPADVTHWQTWIGRRENQSERIDPEALRRFAAAIDEDLEIERRLPSLAHWAFFLPVVPASDIGEDGHPRRGGFLPPISLPRRMFAAADMRFHAPLTIGETAERVSTVKGVTHKAGRSGDLVLVEVEHRIAQHGQDRIVETQTIVYRDAGAPTPPLVPADPARTEGDVAWRPGPVDLFRFSAVTFNSHRIHYDLPYATGEEGYAGLVVHGPLTACRLFGHARRGGRSPVRFAFRAVTPIFCGGGVLLREDAPGACRAIRGDGADAMTATVEY